MALQGFGQTKPNVTQQAKNARCSNIVALAGNVNIKCSALTPEQRKLIEGIPAVLNKILANQLDPSAVMAKLDEILAAASRPTQTCIGSNCAGTNYGNQSINFGTPHPPPSISFIQEPIKPATSANDQQKQMTPGIDRPGVKVTITLNDIFYNPAFVVRCSVPCTLSEGIVEGASSVQALNSPQDPTIAGAMFTIPSQMFTGTKVFLSFRSNDNRAVSVLEAAPYIPPRRY
jgi:uncharacterized membrane protein